MAKKTRKQPPLPHVQVAALCEAILDEKDNVQSAIRLVDTFTVLDPSQLPEGMPPGLLILKLLLMLKAGDVNGDRTIKVVLIKPSGESVSTVAAPAVFSGDETGVVIRAQLGVNVEAEGLYWLDVLVDENMVTRVPFRVKYQNISTAEAAGQTPTTATPAPESAKEPKTRSKRTSTG